ncbi:MAG: TlpA family protein disulfide reductase [Elusimicrobia bacterium]|nr:TlpA family protein disulfide reductase [Elusimicrobiota bacterium]
MTPQTVRRSLWVLPALFGTILWTACGSNSGSQTPRPPARVDSPADMSVGPNRAPGFSLLDTRGNSVALADFKGKVVFIDFWATWCPPCRISMPEVEKLYATYQGKHVQILGLNLDEDGDSARRFVEKKKIPYPVLLAGQSDIGGAYGVNGIPHFALIDQEGNFVNMWSGFAPGMGDEWRAAINTLLGA